MDIKPYLPGNKEASEAFEYGWAFMERYKDYLNAQPRFGEAIYLVPDFALAYHCHGVCLAHLGEGERALADLKRSRELGLDWPEYYYGLGVALAALNENEAALKNFGAITKIKPELADTYKERADLYLKLGDEDKALCDYSKAIERNVFQLGYCHYQRALIYIARDELERALADLNEARILDTKDWKILFHRGHCNYKLNRLEKAAEDYRNVLYYNPTFADAYYCLGNTLYEMQDLEGAIRNHTQVVIKEPQAFEGHFARGLAYLTKGDFAFAINDFLNAISINPEDSEAHYLLSEAYAGSGEEEAAQASLLKAKELGFEP
ncbi:MAG: tetratricopeptide repeat protein [Clostridiales bacterium]|nr:tetratricopeptide repeat protein [Clostridiales bacterium]